MDLSKYNKIMIVGNNGSGKSYLAKELANITKLPLIHLDCEFWGPNWEMPSKEEWHQKNLEFISKEKWIIDGMCSHGGTMELRFEAADLIIFLDFNRLICLSGVLKRNGKKRSDTTTYLYEKKDKQFLEFCKGIWSFPKTRKLTILDLQKKYINNEFFVIKNRREEMKLLNKWKNDIKIK